MSQPTQKPKRRKTHSVYSSRNNNANLKYYMKFGHTTSTGRMSPRHGIGDAP